MTRRDGEIKTVSVSAPMRGRPLSIAQFSQDHHPIVFDLLRRLANGHVVEANLDEESLEHLAKAGFLIEEQFIPTEPRRPESLHIAPVYGEAPEISRAAFARDRYAVLRRLIPAEPLAALQTYYHEFVAGGFAQFEDRRGLLRWWSHNEPIARSIQEQLTDVVSDVVGTSVKPSYAYFVSYCRETELKQHRDRAECAFSISLLLDYLPRPGDVSPWPLWLRLVDDRSVAISLGPGDALFYCGTELTHWREPLFPGHTSTSLLLHYVPMDFTGRLD